MRLSRTKAAAVIGSLAITGTFLLAGCGGSSSNADAPSAAASWNPLRPTGVADDLWAMLSEDPAAKDPTNLAANCPTLTPMSASDIDGSVGFGAGSTPGEWMAYDDYTFAYLTALCASLPSGAAAAPTEPSAEASA